MSTPLDTVALAKQDIIARPEITGGDKEPTQVITPAAAKPDIKADILEANRLEEAASAVITETANEIRRHFGGKDNENMSILLNEMLNGSFAALRALSGKPWLSFVVATGAFSIALLPPVIRRYIAAKEEKKENEHD